MMFELIENAYKVLKEYGYCRDQQSFSRDWLNHSKGYYAHLQSTGRCCGASTSGVLAARLKALLPICLSQVENRRLGAAWVSIETMHQAQVEALHRKPTKKSLKKSGTALEGQGKERMKLVGGMVRAAINAETAVSNDNERVVDRSCDLCGEHFECGSFVFLGNGAVAVQCASCRTPEPL